MEPCVVRVESDKVIRMRYWNGSGMSGWGYVLMTLNTLIFWAVVIAAIVLLVRHFGRTSAGQGGAARPSPEEVLAQRYAQGEIEAEDYRARLDTLRGTRPSGRAA
jgi:putative membrane protein